MWHQIDLSAKRSLDSRGFRNHPQQIGYDHFDHCTGIGHQLYSPQVLPSLAVPMKSLSDAISIARPDLATWKGKFRM